VRGRKRCPDGSDLDYSAIATALGIETGTVAATLNAAHRKLESTLKEPAA